MGKTCDRYKVMITGRTTQQCENLRKNGRHKETIKKLKTLGLNVKILSSEPGNGKGGLRPAVEHQTEIQTRDSQFRTQCAIHGFIRATELCFSDNLIETRPRIYVQSAVRYRSLHLPVSYHNYNLFRATSQGCVISSGNESHPMMSWCGNRDTTQSH